MTAEEVLDLFERRARPYLNMAFQPNTCIEQTRILLEVLKRFGIAAEPLATKFHLVCAARNFQFFSSGDPEDVERARKHDAGYRERPNDKGEVCGYHTVALVERRLFVDMTASQASSDEFDFRIDREMTVIPLGRTVPEGDLPEIQADAVNDSGVPFTVRWIGVKDRDWEGTEAWEPSHLWPLIDRIETEMWEEHMAQVKNQI